MRARLNVASYRLWIGLLSLGVALGFWAPALVDLQATGFGDWQMIHHNWEVGRVALSRFGQWPLWNPFFCGGITAFGNPETQWFSPLTWIALLTGSTVGTKVFLVAHAAIGLSGMFVFAREHAQLRALPAALSALVWGCSGFFAWHGAGGHATFLPFYFAPWLLWSQRRAWLDPRYAILTAIVLAWTLYEGGTYPFPYFVLWLAVDALSGGGLPQASPASGERGWRRHLRGVAIALLIAGVLTALLGAIRLLPIADALSRLPRQTIDDDSLRLGELIDMLTARDHGWRNPPHRFVWPEYGTFIGWPALGLCALGLLAAARRQAWVWPLGLCVFVAITLGEGGPWSWLHRLPVFDSLRVPSRFMVVVTFYVAILAGLGLQALLDLLAGWRAPDKVQLLAALVMVAIVGVDLFSVNLRTVDRWDGPPVLGGPAAERFHLMRARGFHHLYASLPGRHVGIAGCYNGGMSWVVSPALWLGDVPQARLSPPTAGVVGRFARQVNTLQVEVSVREPGARLLINQNHDPDFQSNVGRIVAEHGLLALELPPGEHQVELRYAPRTLVPGLLLTGLGWGLAFGLWSWLCRGRRAKLT